MAKDKTAAAEPKTPGKMRQIRNAYTLTRRTDKRIGLVLFAVFVGTFAAVLALGFLLDVPVIFGITAFFTALLFVLFGIAALYVHLASDESSYATGQVMGASGGGGMP